MPDPKKPAEEEKKPLEELSSGDADRAVGGFAPQPEPPLVANIGQNIAKGLPGQRQQG
jgi:hypothetical protein